MQSQREYNRGEHCHNHIHHNNPTLERGPATTEVRLNTGWWRHNAYFGRARGHGVRRILCKCRWTKIRDEIWSVRSWITRPDLQQTYLCGQLESHCQRPGHGEAQKIACCTTFHVQPWNHKTHTLQSAYGRPLSRYCLPLNPRKNFRQTRKVETKGNHLLLGVYAYTAWPLYRQSRPCERISASLPCSVKRYADGRNACLGIDWFTYRGYTSCITACLQRLHSCYPVQ